MLRIIVLILATIIAGCATQSIPPIPKPAPACDMTVAGNCHTMSSSESAGAGSRGHADESKETP